eukprot:gnl/MRDRNA2_/MRDRNA2_70975_c0_seq1.p1 gnl/MRDRNA2_/MRDRNA2_70975_c0~~gnl/MRDRNA2_/MRDRNA2_70975_c0_seq1.p1  ORF type:complete len:390 (+),score=66.37 gnl/MRDRNA2_/MRDRNA2_70975_c0_seq1:77-1171(+)
MPLPQQIRDSIVLFLVLNSAVANPTKPTDVYTLNDGNHIPVIGVGVYRVKPGKTTYDTVLAALNLGYRMIDTAAFYENEGDVGRAIRDSGIPRSQVFVTTKLKDTDHGFDQAIRAGHLSNTTLGLGHIDLYLIHSPGMLAPGKIVETWNALVQLKKEGVTRSIGVSNFGVAHLEALEKHGLQVPAVNQFELHPMVMKERSGVVTYCKKHNVLVQPYGSVFSGHDELLQKFSSMAEKHHKTHAQLLLRWALDQNFCVIPKSTHLERLKENFNVFDFSLSDSEIASMSSLSGGRLKDYWNPLNIPVHEGTVVGTSGSEQSTTTLGSRIFKKGRSASRSSFAAQLKPEERTVRVAVNAKAQPMHAEE